MLPASPLGPLLVGWSSRATSERTSEMRAGLAARTITALLRGSAISVVRKALSVWPATGAAPCTGAAPGDVPAVPEPVSTSRLSSGTRSVALAYFSGITSRSVALDTSMAAMMRAMRSRFSA